MKFCMHIHLILTASSPKDCQMLFVIDRGFAELQILSVNPQAVCEAFVPGQFAKNAHNS